MQHLHLFVDSQIVLAWVHTEVTRLQTYVANRIRAIQELSSHNCCQWGYVDTSNNPANCISRGLQPNELRDHSIWWYGPSHLQDINFVFTNDFDMRVSMPETKSEHDRKPCPPVVCAVATNKNTSIPHEIINKFSDINKMTRVLAYVLRYCNNLKPKSVKCKESYLRTDELNNALLLLIRTEQDKYYNR